MEAATMSKIQRHVCWICGREVPLENCKTDEQGFAVHDVCYVARVALANESMRVRKIPPKPVPYRFTLDMRFAKRL
jgi:hypothetical protein